LRNFRLRTKFLLSLVVISAGLTTGTLLIVRYSVQKRVLNNLQEQLNASVNTYQTFDEQREETLTRSAELLATLPNVRALMATADAPTIQDTSVDIQRQSKTDLLVLASRSGEVMGLHTSTSGFSREMAQDFLQKSLTKQDSKDWWFGNGHLYEVWLQPIYLGAPSTSATLGFLVVGYDLNEQAAENFSNIAATDVAFYWGNTMVASTLPADERMQLTEQFRGDRTGTGGIAHEWKLGKEEYLAKTVKLSAHEGSTVSLTVLQSVDKATQFLSDLNHVLLALGLLSVIAGSALVFLISHTFTKPLASLVAGVRALEQGNFTHPLETGSGDEVGEVTGAFDRMRHSLQKTQQEQKQLEERLRQAHKMEAVGRLAGGVAHDFNNLLTIISGHGDLLHERVGAVPAHLHSVEQIQKAAGRAVSMTRQLLAFSRMQVLQPRVLDLNAVVADMGKMLPRLIGENIQFKFVADPAIARIKADPGQIEQVIMNLVVNSRDAMPDGGTITVRTREVAMSEAEALKHAPMPAGQYVQLSVSDTGHGMSEETKTHIFEPFFTTKEIGKGTGLGLATVYGVVKQSGAFIWVESELRKGTTFEIYFVPAEEMATQDEGGSKKGPLQRGSKEMILVVEDESGVRELTCEFLKVSGYQVLQAKDGVEALELMKRHDGSIDLMLSDVVMPNMGGRELATRMKTIRPNTKVLFMSGYAEYCSPGSEQAEFQETILQKPFSISVLIDKVRETLSGTGVESSTEKRVPIA
jgi:signal transduction histidine kinase